jgi:pectate lyase
MRIKYLNLTLAIIIIFLLIGSCKPSGNSDRLKAVKVFADNVLEKGSDQWSGKHTPLLADGINLESGDPIEFIYDGKLGLMGEGGPAKKWIIHNLASQQNLFRTFVGLTNLTGDTKYRSAAEKEIAYNFDSLNDGSGLLHWGGHQVIDLRTLKNIGHSWKSNVNVHELKDVFPYYELMWDVNKEATGKYIRAFWNAHVLDWSTLEFNRHGGYGKSLGKLWDSEFKQPEPFFEGEGLSFINTGSDLIYAGSMLYVLNKEEGALKWSKLLAEQYVRARHPVTGLGSYQFSKTTRHQQPPAEGPLTGLLTWANYGDRAENQFGKDFPGVAREGWAIFMGSIYEKPPLMQLELAEKLGENGKEFLNWTISGLKAYAKYGYDASTNRFRPMWADGTDLTGYAFPRSGYYGEKGRILKQYEADEVFLFTYSRAYRLSRDKDIWNMVRSIMKGLQLGDPGSEPGKGSALTLDTKNSDPKALFALLELNRAIDDPNYLKLAEVIGNNILARSFHKGFFLENSDQKNVDFDIIEPLALLSLEAALRGKPELVPIYSGGMNHIDLKTE